MGVLFLLLPLSKYMVFVFIFSWDGCFLVSIFSPLESLEKSRCFLKVFHVFITTKSNVHGSIGMDKFHHVPEPLLGRYIWLA